MEMECGEDDDADDADDSDDVDTSGEKLEFGCPGGVDGPSADPDSKDRVELSPAPFDCGDFTGLGCWVCDDSTIWWSTPAPWYGLLNSLSLRFSAAATRIAASSSAIVRPNDTSGVVDSFRFFNMILYLVMNMMVSVSTAMRNTHTQYATSSASLPRAAASSMTGKSTERPVMLYIENSI